MSLTQYTPTNKVQAVHTLPHLNSQLQSQSSTFEYSMSYLYSLFPFPLILLSISLFFVFGYVLVVFSRFIYRSCCRKCWCPKRKLDPERESFAIRAVKKVSRHKEAVRKFLVSLTSLFITNFFVWLVCTLLQPM